MKFYLIELFYLPLRKIVIKIQIPRNISEFFCRIDAEANDRIPRKRTTSSCNSNTTKIEIATILVCKYYKGRLWNGFPTVCFGCCCYRVVYTFIATGFGFIGNRCINLRLRIPSRHRFLITGN